MSRVLITGGADGLGRALALFYMRKGSDVTILDEDACRGRALARQNSRISFLHADLRSSLSEKDVGRLKYPIDLVICNAGISASGDFTDIPFEKERDVFEVNVFGHMRLLKYLLRMQQIRRGGHLAFIASATTYCPLPIAAGYAASKAAIDGLALALEAHLTEQHISVTRVYPGPMKTRHHEKYYPNLAFL